MRREGKGTEAVAKGRREGNTEMDGAEKSCWVDRGKPLTRRLGIQG